MHKIVFFRMWSMSENVENGVLRYQKLVYVRYEYVYFYIFAWRKCAEMEACGSEASKSKCLPAVCGAKLFGAVLGAVWGYFRSYLGLF